MQAQLALHLTQNNHPDVRFGPPVGRDDLDKGRSGEAGRGNPVE